ncbi:MAG: glycosyltransferase family 1 protein [Patescibacteria group bacterium]|nr:glycosyltransferase family 1 protein [Patescibacteria group bacterium]
MKIAIDCADLDYARIDGTRVYIKNMLDRFGSLDGRSTFYLYHKSDFNKVLKPVFYQNYIDRKIPYPWWWTQTRFAYELRADRPHKCWMPIQQIPFIGPKETKYIITIHDLAFKIFSGHFPRKDILKLNFFTDMAIKRADRIIAISQSTKKDILKFYPKTHKDKIIVIHHGFDQRLFSKQISPDELLSVLKKHKIANSENEHRYLLYVGAIQPRKNLVTLLKAFEMIKRKEGFDDMKLVFAGEQAWLSKKIIQRIDNSSFTHDIIKTGKIDFMELACLYRKAEIFVYPSLYEGFGIPILESFASETPVVVADNSSLPEIGGDAVVKFSSLDSRELARILQNILKHRTIREEMVKKGLERIKRFSWEKCAKNTLLAIKEA